MIGDYWVSNKTGNVYEVGPKGTRWRVVGHVDDLEGTSGILGGGAALLGYLGATLGLSVIAAVFTAAFIGLVLGAILMFWPVAIPFSIPALLLGLVVVGVRSVVTRQRKAAVWWATLAFIAVLVLVVLHVVFWPHHPGLYVTAASMPILPVLTLVLAVLAVARRRWGITALLLAQTVVYASSYLGAVGSLTYAESSTAFDNLLTLGYWLCIAHLVSAWLSPRRFIRGATEQDGIAYAEEIPG